MFSNNTSILIISCSLSLWKVVFKLRKGASIIRFVGRFARGKNSRWFKLLNWTGLHCSFWFGDQDYIAAFDYLVLDWVWRVLDQKGVKKNNYKSSQFFICTLQSSCVRLGPTAEEQVRWIAHRACRVLVLHLCITVWPGRL